MAEAQDIKVDDELLKHLDEDLNPRNSRAYTRKDYWDLRFSKEESYDWLAKYKDIREDLRSTLRPEHRILIVGCGNSDLTREMYEDGFKNLVSTDYSEVVVDKMKSRCKGLEDVRWEVADMLKLPYEAKSFDAVVDKGAMDAVMADGGDRFDPSMEIKRSAAAIAREAHRVLRPGGVYIQVSFAQPHFRSPLLSKRPLSNSTTVASQETKLDEADSSDSEEWEPTTADAGSNQDVADGGEEEPEKPDWEVEVRRIDVGFGYFMYIMRR